MYTWSKFSLDNNGKKYLTFLSFFKKRKLLSDYNKAIRDIKIKIDTIEPVLMHSKYNNWTDIYKIWNIAGFILMVVLDIKVINKSLFVSRGFGEDEYIIKNACILIYETLDSIERMLGKKFKCSLDNLFISNTLVLQLESKKQDLINFKQLYDNDLYKVRNFIAAHRDHDFLDQLIIFKQLEITSMMRLILEFEKILYSVSESLGKIMNESTENFIKCQKQ